MDKPERNQVSGPWMLADWDWGSTALPQRLTQPSRELRGIGSGRREICGPRLCSSRPAHEQFAARA